jgi:hypothetical protein
MYHIYVHRSCRLDWRRECIVYECIVYEYSIEAILEAIVYDNVVSEVCIICASILPS